MLRNRLAKRLRRLGRTVAHRLAGQRGASTAEYALILTLVVVILISTLSTLGAVLDEKLRDIILQIQGAG